MSKWVGVAVLALGILTSAVGLRAAVSYGSTVVINPVPRVVINPVPR